MTLTRIDRKQISFSEYHQTKKMDYDYRPCRCESPIQTENKSAKDVNILFLKFRILYLLHNITIKAIIASNSGEIFIY